MKVFEKWLKYSIRSKIDVTWHVFLYFRVNSNQDLTYLTSMKSQNGACSYHEDFIFKEKLTKQIKEDENFRLFFSSTYSDNIYISLESLFFADQRYIIFFQTVFFIFPV